MRLKEKSVSTFVDGGGGRVQPDERDVPLPPGGPGPVRVQADLLRAEPLGGGAPGAVRLPPDVPLAQDDGGHLLLARLVAVGGGHHVAAVEEGAAAPVLQAATRLLPIHMMAKWDRKIMMHIGLI